MLIFSNELLSFMTIGDTLILDGQVIYLDQDTLNETERNQFDFDSDYRRVRKRGIWGLEGNIGSFTMLTVPFEGQAGQTSLYSISPNFQKRAWGLGFSATGYYHLHDHFALRSGIEVQQIHWQSLYLEDIQTWNEKDIYDASFNSNGLQAYYRVLVDPGLGLYELDTLTLNPQQQNNSLNVISVPVMAAFHLSSAKKRNQTPNMLMLEMGAVCHLRKMKVQAFTTISESHELINVSKLSLDREQQWAMRSAVTWKRLLNKKGMHAFFWVTRMQVDWPAGLWNQSGWYGKWPSSYLTFGMLWEHGKSLHSLNN